jgi:hypothetical protein
LIKKLINLKAKENINKEKIKRLKILLKDDFQSFVFIANTYVKNKIIEPSVVNNLFDKGLRRNYLYNKQQNN